MFDTNVVLFFVCLLVLHLAEVQAEDTGYLGCYNDGGPTNRLITGYQTELNATNSPEVCTKLCHSIKFAIAGIQNGYQCFCGNIRPSFKLRAEDVDCNKKCPGEKCEDGWRVNVYKTGLKEANIENSDKELEYIGCFIHDLNNKLPNYIRKEYPNKLTPHYCTGYCHLLGYLYAGLRNGFECFCGDTHPFSESKDDETQCNVPCSGDDEKKCGGTWRLSIYSTSITDYPVDGRYLGCFEYSDEKTVLTEKKFYLRDTNTPRRCTNLCFVNNFQYAGLHAKNECYCGNNKLPLNAVPDRDCRLLCPGDSTERCGGHTRISIFRTGSVIDNSLQFQNPTYLGCFKDEGSDTKRLFKGYQQDKPGKLTPELCIDICRSKGFHYSATKYMHQCFCDNKRPPKDLIVSVNQCDSLCAGDSYQTCGGDWALSVYKNGLKGSEGDKGNYAGCYEDKPEPNRLLTGSKYLSKKQNIILCVSTCLSLGFKLAGLERKEECYCGDTDLSSAKLLKDSECNSECLGNKAEKCGADLKLSVYKTGITYKSEKEIERSYMGCFDSKNDKIFKRHYKVELDNNTAQHCIGVCKALGYQFSGIEYGVQCLCGYVIPTQDLKVNDSECLSTKCPGNDKTFCGGGWRMAVYSINGEGYCDFNGGDGKCDATVSTVNGKPSCKNKVVFQENFSKLSKDTWQHTVKISDLPDENFVVFSKDEGNSFVEDGKLIIKPSLLPKDIVFGYLRLDGCTGVIRTPECTMHSSGYRIIPPVTSAELSTKNSFYFRYGIVEIIAKFPTGDWIVPELYLEPKHQVYGPQFLSGRIKMAMTVGNQNLITKAGEVIGSNCLEAGVVMGEEDEIKKRKISKCISEGWNKRFHNYTIIWTPDDIEFIIDGEKQISLMNGIQNSKLCAEIGLEHLCSKIWTSDSKIAPFDKDFYIKLGVTIGGNRIFPDGCLTNYGKLKPWKNSETKPMLNFWYKKDEWTQTWTDPSFKIDSIKVTTL